VIRKQDFAVLDIDCVIDFTALKGYSAWLSFCLAGA
jgi:hypothetical protein